MNKGYITVEKPEAIAGIYSGIVPEELRPNQYALIEDESGKVTDIYKYRNDRLEKAHWEPVPVGRTQRLRPLNTEQKMAFDMLQDERVPVKVLTGSWGTGKTYLMISHALYLLASKKISKIIWVRNNFGLADTKDIGHLAGTLEEKILPFAGPLLDHMQPSEFRTRIAQGDIELAHLGFMRGRSIKDAVILCSEAQNLTVNQVQLLLGRVEKGSQLWLEGDTKSQQDHRAFIESPGLDTAIKALAETPLFGYVHLEKTERSKVAELASLLTNDNLKTLGIKK